MNPYEIEQKIIEDLKKIRTPEELKALQKWAKKAKKNPVHEPKVENFGKIHYQYEYVTRGGSGSKARYRSVRTVEYCYFTFLGMKITLEENNNKNFNFSEERFNSKQIWGDNRLKYIGIGYYPKEEITEFQGINLEQKFLEYLKNKKYHLVVTAKKLYLSNETSITEKIIMGRRLKKWDKEKTPSFSKKLLSYFNGKDIEIKDSTTYFDNEDNNVDFDLFNL